MSKLKSAATQHPERRAAPTVTRAAKPMLQRILIVAESEQDLAWLGRMKAMSFDPILMFSNFDAVQRMTEELDLKLVLFAQRSLMMDGITACQLLRQSRSEADVAIVLLLDDNLEEAIAEAFAAGASDVVCQPYFASELIARVDAARQRLQLWNDVETCESFGTPAKTSTTLGDAECTPMRPHFRSPIRSTPVSLDDSQTLDNPPSQEGLDDSEAWEVHCEAPVKTPVSAPVAVVPDVVAPPVAIVADVAAPPVAVVADVVALPVAVVADVVAPPVAVISDVATPPVAAVADAVVSDVAIPPVAVVADVVARPIADVAALPERSPPTTTMLLGDWLLTHDLPQGLKPPSLDLTQLKFVPTLSAPQAAAARQRGEVSEVLLDRVWVCPQCRALPSFRPACSCCGSAIVERDRMLHHFACAFVGSTGEFQVSDEGLACPKCCTQRLMVGTDCEYLDGPWRCTDCDWNTAELEIVGHCLKCGFRFPAQQAVLEDLVGHCVAD